MTSELPEETVEDGEIAFLGNDPYLVDPSFKFRNDPLHKVNWRNISRINLASLRHASFEDVNEVFRQNVDDIAYCDLKEEQRCVWISNEGKEAMRVMQLGMQYLMFQRQQIANGVLALEQSATEQA